MLITTSHNNGRDRDCTIYSLPPDSYSLAGQPIWNMDSYNKYFSITLFIRSICNRPDRMQKKGLKNLKQNHVP